MAPHPAQRRRSLPAHWWAVLAFVLVLGQTLGQWHQGFHALALQGGAAPSVVTAAGHEHGAAPTEHGHTAGGWLGRLFAGHGALDCRLLDQLAHADAPGFAPPVVPVAQAGSAPLPLWRAPAAPAPSGAPYSARAPPVAA